MPNLRDLGGWSGVDGRLVRDGVLYRSTDFSSMATIDLETFEKLGVRAIYDLRTATERTALPDPDLPEVTDIHLDVLADAPVAIPADLQHVFSDPATVAMVTKELSGDNARRLISDTYRQLVSLPSAVSAYRSFYRGLLAADAVSRFHCTTG